MQVRNGMAHGVGKAEADDVPRLLVGGDRQFEIGAGRLDGLDNRPGRIKQRPVPVKNNKFIFHDCLKTSGNCSLANSRVFSRFTAAM